MSDNTKTWILKEVLPLVVVVGGSVGGSLLWITNELGDVRSEIADVRERVASVEGKLDLLISGLDMQVGVPVAPDRPDQPTRPR